jgi:hypothetical protein
MKIGCQQDKQHLSRLGIRKCGSKKRKTTTNNTVMENKLTCFENHQVPGKERFFFKFDPKYSPIPKFVHDNSEEALKQRLKELETTVHNLRDALQERNQQIDRLKEILAMKEQVIIEQRAAKEICNHHFDVTETLRHSSSLTMVSYEMDFIDLNKEYEEPDAR